MSKTVSGPTEANITDNNHFVRCFFVKQRISGTIQGFTEHDKDIIQDLSDGNGAVTYNAAASFIPKAVASTNMFSVDNTEVEGVLDPSAFSTADVDAGIYDRAEIKIFLVDWTDLTLDPIKIRRGTIGTIEIAEKAFKAQLRGMLQRYTEEIVEVYTPACRADYGDIRCGDRPDPPTWTAVTAYTVRPPRDARLGSIVKPSSFNDRHFKCTVAGTSGGSEPSWDTTLGNTTVEAVSGGPTWEAIRARTLITTVSAASGDVTSNREFVIAYTGDAPDTFITGGLVTWLSGSNVDVPPMEVKTWDLATETIILFLPMPFDVVGGESIEIQAGCLKDVPTCRDTFDNIFNFIGEPYVPGTKVLFRTPNTQ